MTCDMDATCDILNESFYSPIIITPTNPSCSSTTTTTTSSMSDGFTCDTSLMVENETLKKEVNDLTHTLGKSYDSKARLLKLVRRPLFLTKLVL